jgi:hypothetical protein
LVTRVISIRELIVGMLNVSGTDKDTLMLASLGSKSLLWNGYNKHKAFKIIAQPFTT